LLCGALVIRIVAGRLLGEYRPHILLAFLSRVCMAWAGGVWGVGEWERAVGGRPGFGHAVGS
jgi:hypothetical protein